MFRAVETLIRHARRHPVEHGDVPVDSYEAAAELLARAVPFYWDRDPLALLNAGADALSKDDVIDRDTPMPCPTGFWWFGDGVTFGCDSHADCSSLQALLWDEDERVVEPAGINGMILAMMTVAAGHTGPGPTQCREYHYVWAGFRTGETLHDALLRSQSLVQFGDLDSWRMSVSVLALLLFTAGRRFLNQAILTTASHRPERAIRRRLEREGYQHEPLIRVIELRRREYERHEPDERRDVEWSCQWITRGHWHRYHTKDGLQPRWVAPYLKGPSDTPLKRPRADVFAVVR
jgi:hypothetical protein